MQKNYQKLNVKQLTFVAIMVGITIFLGASGLGFIPLAGMKITILHLPTILSAILAGPFIGGLTGLFFGIFSFVQNIIAPTPLSFVFYNRLVSIFPRILIGVFSGLFFQKFSGIIKKEGLSYLLTSILGTLTNTAFVLGLAGAFHHERILETFQIPAKVVLLGIVGTNLPFELILSALLIPILCIPLKKYYYQYFTP